MGVYASSDIIAARAGGRPLDETTVPALSDVDAWIDEAEAELLGTLARAGIPTSYTAGSRGALTLRSWVANYVAGLLRVSLAAAGGDGSNADGQKLVDGWRDLLEAILKDPTGYGAVLDPGGAAPTSATSAGNHLTDDILGLSDADVAPVFRIRGEHW